MDIEYTILILYTTVIMKITQIDSFKLPYISCLNACCPLLNLNFILNTYQ